MVGVGGVMRVCVWGGGVVCECVCLHKCAYMFNQKHHLCVGVLMCVCVWGGGGVTCVCINVWQTG